MRRLCLLFGVSRCAQVQFISAEVDFLFFFLFFLAFLFFFFLIPSYGSVKTALRGCCSSVKRFKIFFSSSVFSEALKHVLSFNKALILPLKIRASSSILLKKGRFAESVWGSVLTITP